MSRFALGLGRAVTLYLMKWLRLPALISCVLLAPMALAVDVAELYKAEIQVPDDGDQARAKALSSALKKVLIQVSGNQKIVERDEALVILPQATDLLQQYSYRHEEVAAKDLVDEQAGKRFYLQTVFDREATERLMRSHGLPVWTGIRPQVLLWTTLENNGARQLVNLQESAKISAELEALAQRRSMPLQIPLMDLTDQSTLTAADLWSDYRPAIDKASERYPHDVITTLKLSPTVQAEWLARWNVYRGDQLIQFETQAPAAQAALMDGLNELQDRLSDLAAQDVVSDEPIKVSMWIDPVESVQLYSKVMSRLRNDPTLTDLQLHVLDGTGMQVSVKVRGGRQELEKLLTREAEFGVTPMTALQAQQGVDLVLKPELITKGVTAQ